MTAFARASPKRGSVRRGPPLRRFAYGLFAAAGGLGLALVILVRADMEPQWQDAESLRKTPSTPLERRIELPRYSLRWNDGASLFVAARWAVPAEDGIDRLLLNAVSAEGERAGGGRLTATAAEAEVFREEKRLVLRGDVVVNGSDGETVRSQEVIVASGGEEIRSPGPVRYQWPGGDLTAGAMDAHWRPGGWRSEFGGRRALCVSTWCERGRIMMRSLGGVALAVALLASAYGATAQQSLVGGITFDSDAPISVSAESVYVDQAAQVAEFRGAVEVEQGGLQLFADEIIVHYADVERDPGGDDVEIQRISAAGSVRFQTDAETVNGGNAVYDLVGERVEITGGVLARRGGDEISGDKFTYDLRTRRGVIEAGASGRVTASFVPNPPRRGIRGMKRRSGRSPPGEVVPLRPPPGRSTPYAARGKPPRQRPARGENVEILPQPSDRPRGQP